MERRVVVTGYGAISGNGNTADEIWASLLAGEARRLPLSGEHYFSTEGVERAYSAGDRLIDTVCGNPLSNKELAELAQMGRAANYDRHQLLAFVAAEEAMNRAHLTDHNESSRFGIVCGTGDGGLGETHTSAQLLINGKGLGVRANLRQLPNTFVGYLAQKYRLRGPSHVHTTACAAGSHAIQHAADLIQLGRTDLMMTGGTEAVITPFGISSFAAQRAISNESLPYQAGRSGFVMAEGAGILILEELEHALARGADIYGELVGWGASSDGDPELAITDPGRGGIASALLALEMADLKPADIHYINTHGTATPAGDKNEIAGIREWASECALDIPLSSTKGATGHALGAGGALEAILCLKMMQYGLCLPTHGLTPENLDPECSGVRHIMGAPLKADIEVVLSNSFGFGGTNATLIFERYD